ncbi:VTT domain-containing protein [Candidatus Parcubacteria bacterium]|nr:VTT domain-containing protein [Candidatus Parcubacteria bacterium]
MNIGMIELIEVLGYLGLFIIVLVESGVIFGFFLPGDSLIFTAGLLASQGMFNIWILGALLALGAILGDSIGYWFGRQVGPTLFNREDSWLFHKRHVARTAAFYEKYGPRAIILARFVPIARTFTPVLAGVGKMRYSTFLRYNVLGAIAWGAGVTLLGFFLGSSIPDAERFLMPIILVIIAVSFLPVLWQMRKKVQPRSAKLEARNGA